MAHIRYFAGAAEAASTTAETVPALSLGELKAALSRRHGAEFDRVLGRCSLLVNGRHTTDGAAPLVETDTVDVLPPFAGG